MVKFKIPEGGEELCDELVRYNTPGGHWYLTPETQIWHKGITTILKNEPMDEGLLRWVASQGGYEHYRNALEQAGKRGDLVHRAIGRLFAGESLDPQDFPEEVARHLMSFLRFCQKYDLDWAAIEQPVWDSRRRIATCIDWRGLLDGKHTSINWKTGKSVYDSAKVQANEEAVLYNGMQRFDDLGPVERWGVVKTNPNFPGKFFVVFSEIDERRHRYFETLREVEAYHDEKWLPELPRPLPKALSLPPSKDGHAQPFVAPAGAHEGNGRPAPQSQDI